MTVLELIEELQKAADLTVQVVIQNDEPKNAKEYEIGPIYCEKQKVLITPIS